MYTDDLTQNAARIRRVLLAVLPPGASLALEDGFPGTTTDVVATVGAQSFRVTWKSRGDLASVRSALTPGMVPQLLIAPRFTAAAREAMHDAGASWVEESGAASVVGDGIVLRLDRPTAGSPEPLVRWTPSVLSVTEAILVGTKPTAEATAIATGHVPSATVSALNTLASMGHLVAGAGRGPKSGRHVVDERRLLDAYADAAAAQRPKFEARYGVLWRDYLSEIDAIGKRWRSNKVQWAATGVLGASLIAPYLTDVTTGTIYVDVTGELLLTRVAQAAGLEPMDGGRLTLRPFPTKGSRTLITTEAGVPVTPWPRVFADLRSSGVRGEEAAEHLYDVVRARRPAADAGGA